MIGQYPHFHQPDHYVIATKALTAYGNIAGHLLTLHERPIFQPLEIALWPDHDALRWHREQCLRA